MLTLTLGNIDQHSDIHIHDAEIGDLLCDYQEHSVTVDLKLFRNNTTEKVRLEFEIVKYLSVSIYESWGNGIYIVEMNIEHENLDATRFLGIQGLGNCFLTTLLLNSGDRIEVLSEVLKYIDPPNAQLQK